jgi:hypothetical protein
MLVFFVAPTVVSALLFFLSGSEGEPGKDSSHSGSHALS